jgi:hypothetical protein
MSLSRSLALPKIPDDSAEVSYSDSPPPQVHECDLCGQAFEGAPPGSGLLLWTRGDEVRYEEPPLCEACSGRLLLGALMRWADDDDDEG